MTAWTSPGRLAEDTAAGRAAGIRLTRRGRTLLVAVLVGLLFAAFSYGRARTEASTTRSATPAAVQMTVQEGDTLWSVARRLAPGRDPRDVVQQIRRLNKLPDATVRVGQELMLPVAA